MKNFLRSLVSTLLMSLAITTAQAQVAPAYAAQGASAGQTGSIGPGSGSVTQVSIVPSDTVTGTVNNPTTTPAITLTAIQNPSPSGTNLVSGGGVEWVSGYTFTIGAATYVIQGTQYSSVITNKTLSASDPTLDRIDVIAVDNTGAVVVIEGTPAATPAKPDVDPASQLELTFVYVSAASTEPIITADDIYHEGTEWTMTRSGSTFNLTSTNNPYRGTTDIEGTNVTTGNAWIATKPAAGVINLADYTTLTMYVRVKSAWPSTRQFSIQWYNGNAARGSIVTLKNGTFGFNALTNTTSYQQISIPVSLFGANGIAINRLRVTCAGSGSTIGMYFDDVTLQSGSTPLADSTKMQWKGTYNATITYNVNDTVTANNVLYVCIQSGIAKDPASNADYWQVAVDASDTGVTSVTGTANEITASPTSGAVGLSLPSSLTFTGKTVTGGTFSGISISGLLTESGTVLITPAPMAALAINVGERMNTKTVGADSTFTFSATPGANTLFGVFITNSDSSSHTMTFPSSTVVPGSGSTTTATLPASGKLYLVWRYDGSVYNLISGYPSSSSGTVTSVSVTTANGVSGSVATATTTPAISLTLGAITPTTVNGNTFTTGSSTYTGTAGQTYTMPATTSTLFGTTTTGHTLQNAQLVTLSSSGTDTFVGTAGVTATAYNTGDWYTFTANTANTGAASININTLGAKTIVKVAGGITTTLADNDIRSGQVCQIYYDGTNFQLASNLGNGAAATPGGSNTQVQFNNSGAFGGSANLVFDGTNLVGAGYLASNMSSPYMALQQSAVTKAAFGVAGATDAFINGSVSGDACFRVDAGSWLISTDNGTTADFRFDKTTKAFRIGSLTGGSASDDRIFAAVNSGFSSVSLLSNDSTASGGSVVRLGRTRGTNASPDYLSSGDLIGSVDYRGWSNGSYLTTSRISTYANQTWNNFSIGSYISFEATPNSSITRAEVFRITGGVGVDVTGNITTTAIGNTLKIKSGSNAKAGTFTLSSGAATVSNTSVTANSVVVMSLKTASGTITAAPYLTAVTVGTSFVVAGSATDNSTYSYIILEVN